MTGLTVGAKGCQPKRRRSRIDRSRKPLCLLWVAANPAVNPQRHGRTVPGRDDMVPLKLLPMCGTAEKVERDFKQILRLLSGIVGAAVAEVEGNAATVYVVTAGRARRVGIDTRQVKP